MPDFFSPLRACAALPLLAALLMGAAPAAYPQGFTATSGAGTVSDTVLTPHVRATLVAHAPGGIKPQGEVWLGLLIEHQPEWHTYWKNPGDSGLPTELHWTLPEGIQAGDIAWPLPEKIRVSSLVNYGYSNTLLLPVPLEVMPAFAPPAAFSGGEVEIGLQATWLVCRQECIPEEGAFRIRLPVHSSTAMHGSLFAQAWDAQPQALASADADAAQVADNGKSVSVSIAALPQALAGQVLDVFPEDSAVFDESALEQNEWPQRWQDGVWQAELPLSTWRDAAPEQLALVLAAADGASWRMLVPVHGEWPQVAPPGQFAHSLPPSAANETALAPSSNTPSAAAGAGIRMGLLMALAGALIGGFILNFMPCVLPILAIKALNLAGHGGNRRAQVATALAYTAGVVCSFLALGALMLALRAAGAQLGWGFQLQSPAVVAALAVLFTVIGLNLAGVFNFGQMVPATLAGVQLRSPTLDALFSGVLAVVLASPCTAPFMAASLGVALSMSAVHALLLFAALGLGMALPFLVIGLVPGAARWLPRPGAWMEAFRRFMSFPMFATTVFLLWVLGQQSGVNGAAALLALLVALAALIWSLAQQGRTRLVTSGIAAAALLGLLVWTGPAVVRPAAAMPVAHAGDQEWQPWSAERVRELNAAGQSVFVDFTAAWCVTCQYNKSTTLSHPQLLAEMRERNIALLRADWTLRDDAITEELRRLGRSGVPVYAWHAPGQPPRLLSEIITVAQVREVISAADKPLSQ